MKSICIALALTIAVCGCNSKQKDRDAQLAWTKFQNDAQQRIDEARAQTAQLDREYVKLQFGTAASILWDKCQTPPKNPDHQRACKSLFDKLEKSNKISQDAIAREKANW